MAINKKYRLLCIDGEQEILQQYQEIFRDYQETGGLPNDMEVLESKKNDPKEGGHSFVFELVMASSSEEAIILVEQEKEKKRNFSICFIDMNVPGQLNGYETVKQIRGKDPHVFCLLAGMDLSRSNSMQPGLGFDYGWVSLRKPLSAVEVLQLTKTLVEVWSLKQKQEYGIIQLLENLSIIRRIEVEDLFLLLDPILIQLFDCLHLFDGFLSYTSSDGKKEFSLSVGKAEKDQILLDPRIRASVDLIRHEHNQAQRAVLFEMHDLTSTAFCHPDFFLALHVRTSALTYDQKRLLQIFVEKIAAALCSAHQYEGNTVIIQGLQTKNDQLTQVNQQLRTNAERLKRLYDISIRDGLTQIYSQIHFQNTMQNEFLRFHRYDREKIACTKKGLALLMIGVDDFVHYNNCNGHSEGDLVLKIIARILAQRLRTTDFIARYGSDRMVVILHEITPSDAVKVAECLRAKIEDYPFPEEQCQPNKKITVSIGVSHLINNYASKEEFIQSAEEKLFEAKRSGKNQVRADLEAVSGG